jgi:hypothetical protein
VDVPVRARAELVGERDGVRGKLVRGALEDTIGRSSISCSREQIGQFWSMRLWRQNVGIVRLQSSQAEPGLERRSC